MQNLPWIIALVSLALVLPALTYLAIKPRRTQPSKPLPTEWALTARPVFSSDERRVYRLLREALPHHVILSKLPLVRFCQPTDPDEVRYWYDLLGSNHVTFAVCSANGRVLAAIDLDTDRGNSRRITQIKQSVLGACRVRYLRAPVDNLPTVAELQLLVPQSSGSSRGPQPAPVPSFKSSKARLPVAPAPAKARRKERAPLWQDSSLFQDSFFGPDSRLEAYGSTEFGSLGSKEGPVDAGAPRLPDPSEPALPLDDVVGASADPARAAAPTRH